MPLPSGLKVHSLFLTKVSKNEEIMKLFLDRFAFKNCNFKELYFQDHKNE